MKNKIKGWNNEIYWGVIWNALLVMDPFQNVCGWFLVGLNCQFDWPS